MIARLLKADISKALDLTKLSLPPRPTVEEVDWWDFIDPTGDEALRVVVVLGADTTPKEHRRSSVKPIEDAIFDRIHEYEIPLFPYIWIFTRSELKLKRIGKWA
jgi:hypothetical protein